MGPSKPPSKPEREWMAFSVNGKECLVDWEDVPRLFGKNIEAAGGNYLRIIVGKQAHLLHRFILGINDNDQSVVDHINGNPLDNRRSNLRLATPCQNATNSFRNDNTSGFRGVSWCNRRQRWLVQIGANKQRLTLGRFISLEEAKAARLKAEAELHGEFAYRVSRGGGNEESAS